LVWRPWRAWPEWREHPGEEHSYVPTILGSLGGHRVCVEDPRYLAATSLPNTAGVLADLVARVYDGSVFTAN
jgi:hypothetical protein